MFFIFRIQHYILLGDKGLPTLCPQIFGGRGSTILTTVLSFPGTFPPNDFLGKFLMGAEGLAADPVPLISPNKQYICQKTAPGALCGLPPYLYCCVLALLATARGTCTEMHF